MNDLPVGKVGSPSAWVGLDAQVPGSWQIQKLVNLGIRVSGLEGLV